MQGIGNIVLSVEEADKSGWGQGTRFLSFLVLRRHPPAFAKSICPAMQTADCAKFLDKCVIVVVVVRAACQVGLKEIHGHELLLTHSEQRQ